MANEVSRTRLVQRHRACLIRHYSFSFPGPSAQAAEELTRMAILSGYVNERESVPGDALKQWSLRGKAPLWACRAAFDFLWKNGWRPEGEDEQKVAAWFCALNNHTAPEQDG